MKKPLIFIVVLLILGAGYYWYDASRKQVQAPVLDNSGTSAQQAAETAAAATSTAPTTTKPAAKPAAAPKPAATDTAQGTFSSGSEVEGGPSFNIVAIDYDGTGFSPATMDIKVGDYVFFNNKGSANFWPVSDPAGAYSAFDAGKAIAPGKSFKFQFAKAGSWKFIDKLNPDARGVVNVAK